MKILIITQYYWPEVFRINDLADALKARGHDIVVLTGIPNYPTGRFFPGYGVFSPARERRNGVEIRRVPLIPRGRGGGLRLALNYVSFAISASLLAPWVCREQFDAIFVHEPSPITVALPAILMRRLRRIPLLLWVLDLWPESIAAAGSVSSSTLLASVGMLVRFIYRRCDLILVQSRAFTERVIAYGAAPERVRYFPSWAETQFTEPATGPTAVPLPDGFKLVFAGNIGAAQDFETILAAAERLRNEKEIQWILVGDGRMASWVRQQVASRGLAQTVSLPGSFALDAMPGLFAAADALLVTLKADPVFALTIPGKVQSYLACGRPIIAALDGEGARVLRESDAAMVGPSGDATTLADNVFAMYRKSGREREVMGKSGREYYLQHFERDRLMNQLERWIEESRGGELPSTRN